LDQISLIGNVSCFDWKCIIDWDITQRVELYKAKKIQYFEKWEFFFSEGYQIPKDEFFLIILYTFLIYEFNLNMFGRSY
jgi:hypothetical protein